MIPTATTSADAERQPPSPPGNPITPIALLAALVKHARFVIAGVLLGALLALVWSLVVREEFAATTIFAPGDQATPQLSGGLAALGTAFGAGLSLNQGSRSLQFYADVLEGHDLLAAVASDSFATPGSGDGPRPLSALLGQRGETPARVRENTISYLQKHSVATTVNDRTGVIALTVSAPDPELAAAVANRLYGHLEAFNFAMRRSGASSRREFAQRELDKAQSDLAAKEAAMRDFLERNRGGLNAPRLALEQGRLQRRIEVAQLAYRQMTQELVEAKIAEARDTPVFTVVQRAEPPLDRAYPNRKRMTTLGGILGGCLAALAIALYATAGRALALDPESVATLRRAVPWRRRPVGDQAG
jgi:uncharacterized protein involved in exopolysaccharide biosynthesis